VLDSGLIIEEKVMQTATSQKLLRVFLTTALLLLSFQAFAYTQSRVVKGLDGKPIKIQGSVVMIEPHIELSEVLAGGIAEPRKEWSDQARELYPKMVSEVFSANNIERKPDLKVIDAVEPNSRIGQIVRLNQAVSMSILVYTYGGTQLATKKGKQLDWSLGPGVQDIREKTGADYALFTYIEDSYTSKGRAALRVVGLLLLGGDIGGGSQVGVTTLVDLKTGQVVWFNFLAKQTGDLRDEKGARATAKVMLKGFPL
jgi:hypothetical protein